MPTATLRNDLVLRAARGERTSRTPVWLMRQAGRFDPEYLALRERCGLPLEKLFRAPELAAEITLLPRRFGVDALILFQDILTIATPMGAPFRFRPGPVLEHPVRTEREVRRLVDFDPREAMADVAEAIRLVRSELAGELPLLGFAGAPLTVAAFMIEGGSPGGELTHTRTMMRQRPAVMHELLERITTATVSYLAMQIDAGVDAVQLFESVADGLTPEEYSRFAHPYQSSTFAGLPEDPPRILFVKERDCVELMAETGANVLSVGRCVDLASARARLEPGVALQGNVDNHLLVSGSADEIRSAVGSCVRAGGQRGHILNLSHGLLKETPVENVRCLIEACHAIRLEGGPPDASGDGP